MTPLFDKVCKDFPFLSREVHGAPVTYLDNAASAQTPRQVMDAMTKMRESHYANVHRGIHTLSDEATGLYEGAREKVARFLNARLAEEIIFTSGGTDSLNLVAQSFAAPMMQEGDEIILSVLEHHSNIVPWHILREREGVRLLWLRCAPDGSVDREEYQKLFSKRTKLVAMTEMSNVLGSRPPLAEMITIAHEHGAAFVVDGCQGVVHGKTDVAALDCDFYAFSGHKLYGPNGIGVLYGKEKHLEMMRPFRGGGGMIDHVEKTAITYAPAPQRFEAGTPPITQAVGLAAAIDYLELLGWEAIEAHEGELFSHALEEMGNINSVRLLGGAASSRAVLSFLCEGAHPHDIAAVVDRKGVAIRAGHHCAEPLMAHLGISATARASFALYNRHQDVEALARSVRYAIEFFS